MNRTAVLITAVIAVVIVLIAPLAYVAVTGDFTALVRQMTGLEEDSALVSAIFTARENFFA